LLPLLFIQLAVATIVFWLLSHRAEKKFAAESVNQEQEKKEATLPFRVSWVKAAVPLVPLALLFVMSAPLYLVRVPPEWLLADYGIDPIRVCGVVSISAAAGRTMSPVSAVALMCGSLTATSSLDLCKRVALPLLAGVVTVILVALALVHTG